MPLTLRRLQNTFILPMVGRDPKLRPRDHAVHAHIYHYPMLTVSDVAKAFRCSQSTVLRSVARLLETQWVEVYVDPGKSRGQRLIPSMPSHAEHVLKNAFAHRRTTVRYLGEWLMRCALDDNVYDYRRQDEASPPWLITAEGVVLRVDGLYEEAGVAFEFQGPQHFKVSNRYVRTAEELARRQRYDGEKMRLCALNGVRLIELRPEDLELTRLRSILTGVLPLLPPRRPGPLLREYVGMHNHLMKSMANLK